MAGVDPSKPQSFPSWTDYYGKFENGGGIQEPDCTDEKDCGKEVTNYSLRNRDLQMYEGKIRAALHYLLETYRKKGPKNSLESTARHFFYYWLGEKRSNSRKGSTEFRGDIILLCNAINQPSEKGPFGIPCDNPEKVIFDQRKRIFDYYYDYSTVQKKILEDGDASREKWSSYLEGITKACDAIKDYCKPEVENTRGDDQYCKQFEAQYGAYCSAAKLPELEYKLKSAQQEKQSTQLKLNSALHQANKASSLSSTFGTVAAIELPAVIFFLYKYKPWSSWFGKHSSGSSRRKKRSSQQEFDDLTETSTVDFTESSETSSILDSPTVRSSAALYTRPPTQGQPNRGEGRARAGRTGTGRTRTGRNRSPPGGPSISYQNM